MINNAQASDKNDSEPLRACLDSRQLLGRGPLLGGRLCGRSLHVSVGLPRGLSLCQALTRFKRAVRRYQIRLCGKQILRLLPFLLRATHAFLEGLHHQRA